MTRCFVLFLLLASASAPAALGAQRARALAESLAATPRARRASWLSDRRPVGVGDLLTVVVDEHVDASESARANASKQRNQQGQLSAQTSATGAATRFGFSTGLNHTSQAQGDAARHGDLTAVLTVRVMSVEPNGALHIEGQRTVIVDRRQQLVRLKGIVRPDDVSPTNDVPSARVGDVTIEYQGKNLNPKSSIFGRILGMLWP
jgi:flagellar L-ring protein precursor FlgH